MFVPLLDGTNQTSQRTLEDVVCIGYKCPVQTQSKEPGRRPFNTRSVYAPFFCEVYVLLFCASKNKHST